MTKIRLLKPGTIVKRNHDGMRCKVWYQRGRSLFIKPIKKQDWSACQIGIDGVTVLAKRKTSDKEKNTRTVHSLRRRNNGS